MTVHCDMLRRGWIAAVLACASTWSAAQCRAIDDPRWETQAQSAPVPEQSEKSPAAAPGIEFARVSRGQIDVLRAIKARLAETAQINPLVILCEHAAVNAKAIARGPRIPPGGLIAITTALMSLLGSDESMLAFLLAHEMAHLALQHGEQLRRAAQAVATEAVRAGTQAESAQAGSGNPVAAAIFVTQMTAYSREIERQADDVGYELFLAAGYDPRGATRLFEAIRKARGGGEATYLSTHPGLDERISRTLALARDDSKRAAAAENANAIAAENDKYRARADELVRDRRWRELSAHVDSWLAALPSSGLAWYYRGTLLRGSASQKAKAWEAFARGAELDPARAEIWEALVEALLVAGYRSEAAACVTTMMATGMDTRELRERLFDGRLIVDGRTRRALSELWWTREPSGSRFITNDRTLLMLRGADAENVPPDWMPLK